MTFGNPLLAWGALAFSIPLMLHILNRSKFRQVEWGAMHLLESVVKVNHKRFRIEQLILLLVRCAIPALLAFCLARPILTGAQMLTGDAPVSLVILLDTSYSMDANRAGVQRFQEAIDAACAIVGATGRGSEVAVIQTGGSPTPIFDEPVFDSAAVVRRLRTIQAGYGASDMQQSLDAGLTMLSGMSHVRRELVVISDFQPADWTGATNAADAIRQQVDAMSVKPELTLLQVGDEVAGNVAIESVEFSNRPLGVGQQLAVRANLRNYGQASAENARVILKIDGKEYSVSQVALSASSVMQTLFPCSFEQPGSHVIEFEVVVNDPLESDNHFAAAVTIWDQINVLLVDGDPSSQPLAGETDFLSVALTPYSFGRLKLSDLVQTQTVTADKLTADKLAGFRVIVLANVPRLSDSQLESLRHYVRDGGALLLTAGNRIDATWYNEQLFAGDGFLPAEFGVPRGRIDDNGKSARIVAQHFDHPALQFFNESANGDLSTAEIRQWYELKLPEDRSMILTSLSSQTDDAADVSRVKHLPIVMARLDNGDPLLVEKSYGDGVVVLLATSCDADWSDLPMRPLFVPFMQQVVTTMATQLTPPRNIRTGESAVAMFPINSVDGVKGGTGTALSDGDSVNSAASLMTLSIVTPEGGRRGVRLVQQGSMLMAKFDATRRPGVYTMTSPDADSMHFVASTSRAESDLSVLDEPKLTGLAENMSARIVASPAEYLEQDRLRRHGREVWKYVLMTLLVFMFLELVLQQRFSGVRS